MTAFISFLIFIAANIVLIHPAFAEDATSGGTSARKTIQERIDTRKEKIETRIENRVTAAKERMASKEAALKERLQKFRDQKKAQVTQRININLNRINQNQTAQMQKHLEKMSSILDRLEKRVTERSSDIKDPVSAREAIGNARSNIASATAAVRQQAENDYTLTVSSESKVRADAQKMREQLHTDLQKVRKMVIDAKQSVANSIRVAKSGILEIPKEATTSGNK